MKFRLTFLWLLLIGGGMVMAQPEFSLKSGEQLSQLNQFGRSTQQLEAFIQANPSRLYDQSQALLLISYNYMQLGDYAGALAANENSLRIKAQLHADDLVYNYVRFGAIHLLRGNYHEALSYLLKAKDFPIEALRLYAVIDGYLGAAYRGLSQFEQAEKYYRQSIETLSIEYSEDHPDLITSFYHLGKLYLEWGKPEAGRRYFQEGLDRSKSSSAQAFLQILLQNGLGASYAESPRQAEIHHRKALELATGFFGAYHRETARSGIYLAKTLNRQNRPGEARDAIQLAIKCLNPEEPQLTWDQIPDTTTLILDKALLAEALGLKARWLLDAALPAEQKLPLALINSEVAGKMLVDAMEDRMNQADRTELISIARQALEAGIEAGVRLGEDREDAYARRRAFQLVEVIKMLEFRAYTAQAVPLSNPFAQNVQRLRRSLRLAEMNFRRQPLDLTAGKEVYRLWGSYRQLLAEWRTADPAGYRQHVGLSPCAPAELQALLDPNTALLSYFVGDSSTYLFGVGRDDLHAFKIQYPDDVAAADAGLTVTVPQFMAAIDSLDGQKFVELGSRLYQQLLAPAASWLKSKEALLILPDGPIKQLPFAALLTKPYRKKRIQFGKLPYLIQDFTITYQHAASVWGQETGPRTAPAYEFLFLSPVFDQESVARIGSAPCLLFDPNIHPSSLISDGEAFYLLPQAIREAAQLQAVFAQSEQEGRFMLREATTERLFKEELGRTHYLHLASYAFAVGTSPEEAGLVFANTAVFEESPDDGLLFMSELMPRKAAGTDLLSIEFTELAIDSAGKTAGIIPLSGPLLLSGVPNVLYTTQPNGTPLFFPAFYDYLRQGYSPDAAVQKVKKDLIKNEETAAPNLWNGYRLLGK